MGGAGGAAPIGALAGGNPIGAGMVGSGRCCSIINPPQPPNYTLTSAGVIRIILPFCAISA